MSEYGNFLGLDAVHARKKIHMGSWRTPHYFTVCTPNHRAGNRYIVRREDEWEHVTCKRCLERKPTPEKSE